MPKRFMIFYKGEPFAIPYSKQNFAYISFINAQKVLTQIAWMKDTMVPPKYFKESKAYTRMGFIKYMSSLSMEDFSIVEFVEKRKYPFDNGNILLPNYGYKPEEFYKISVEKNND